MFTKNIVGNSQVTWSSIYHCISTYIYTRFFKIGLISMERKLEIDEIT